MSLVLNPGLSFLPILLSNRWFHKLSWVVNTISILIVSKFISLVQTSLLNFRLAFSTACLIFLLGCFTGISSSILIFPPQTCQPSSCLGIISDSSLSFTSICNTLTSLASSVGCMSKMYFQSAPFPPSPLWIPWYKHHHRLQKAPKYSSYF